jgi:glucokinase
MPNLEWKFSRGSLAGELDLRELVVVNDFAAVAWGLPALTAADLHTVGGGVPVGGTAMATLGPGSGLGVATVAPCGDEWAVVEGEGGNISFSGVTPEQQSITDRIRAQSGHCSAESLLSGPGLANIYMALAELQGRDVTRPIPAEVSRAAADGEALAGEALGLFFEVLGTVAGNLALTVGARGGVFIAGGIVPRMLEPLQRSRFRESFEAKGRYRFYLEAIPTYVITEPYPAFLGLRRLLGYG